MFPVAVKRWLTGRGVYTERGAEYNLLPPYFYKPLSNKMWSGTFGEDLVAHALHKKSIPFKRQSRIMMPNGRFHRVDFETPDAVIEVKTRNYSTPGTIGEKLTHEFARLASLCTRKTRILVVIGYQEVEFDRLVSEVPSLQYLFSRVRVVRGSTLEDASFE